MAKRNKKVTPSKNFEEESYDGSTALINKRWEYFCQLYAGVSTRHFFSHAQNCYMEAFGYLDEYNDIETQLVLEDYKKKRKLLSQKKKKIEKTCIAAGSRLLSNVNISKRTGYLFDKFIDEEAADRELAKVIGQDIDLRSKVEAIRLYKQEKGKISDKTPQKIIIEWATSSNK